MKEKEFKNPCLKHYELFELMHDEHGLILLESELNEIVSVVKKTDKGLNELRDEAYETAKSKGFHENKQVDIPRSLMLIVSEISEALEADRKGRWARLDHFDLYMYGVVDEDHEEQFIKHFEAEIKDSPEDELADAIIRILDLCGALNIDIEEHVALKMKYNKTREKLHGKEY